MSSTRPRWGGVACAFPRRRRHRIQRAACRRWRAPRRATSRLTSAVRSRSRALDQSPALGGHGLPLIGRRPERRNEPRRQAGTGRERVARPAPTLRRSPPPRPLPRHETVRAATWPAQAAGLQASLEREAWDSEWHRRGFFDDGTPLGSATSKECRIDSIAQSWAVLSQPSEPGAGRPRHGGGRAGADSARGRASPREPAGYPASREMRGLRGSARLSMGCAATGLSLPNERLDVGGQLSGAREDFNRPDALELHVASPFEGRRRLPGLARRPPQSSGSSAFHQYGAGSVRKNASSCFRRRDVRSYPSPKPDADAILSPLR